MLAWCLSSRVRTTAPHSLSLSLPLHLSLHAQDTLAKYFDDMHGAFAVYTDPPTGNKVLRQQADSIPPLATHGGGATAYSAIIGDPDWAGYSLTTKVRSEGGNTSGGGANRGVAKKGAAGDGEDEFVFVGINGGSDLGTLHPEMFYHAPYRSGGGIVLILDMAGKWSLSADGQTVSGYVPNCERTARRFLQRTSAPLARPALSSRQSPDSQPCPRRIHSRLYLVCVLHLICAFHPHPPRKSNQDWQLEIRELARGRARRAQRRDQRDCDRQRRGAGHCAYGPWLREGTRLGWLWPPPLLVR